MSRYRQTFNEAYQQVEKWYKDVEVKSTGEYAGKTIDQSVVKERLVSQTMIMKIGNLVVKED